MDGYPNSDEEFELMHAEELEVLREFEEEEHTIVGKSTVSKTKEIEDLSKCNKLQTTQENISRNNNDLLLPSTIRDDNHSCSNGNTSQIVQHNQPRSSGNFLSQEDSIDVTKLLSSQNSFSENGLGTRKRTIQELFGDIDDILKEDIGEGQAKKHKNDLENQYALIEHIVELRKLAKEECNFFINTNERVGFKNSNKCNISYKVPRYSFVTVTRHNGERMYVRCHSEKYEKEEIRRIVKNNSFVGIMGESFKTVWKEAEEYLNQDLDKNSNNIDTSNKKDLTDFSEISTQLWVDLYKPRRYLELLSDESTNRTLLRWLKLWDKVVFNRRPKEKIRKIYSETQTNWFQKHELDTNLDEHGRPKFKVALLCGPPGLGKTTLAHMIANHAGYNVVEINASDDRSTEEFRIVLENSTQMRSIIDKENRPNCIVFDEIDGAPSTSIELLVKFINGTVAKRKKTTTILKRPIICICNDVYVPALRPLRQIAFVVNFPPTASARLAERLNDIARHQKIETDLGALNALCEKCGNDIRSCLSVLHFYKSLSKRITLTEIIKTSVGQKDMQKGLFSVWQEIFQVQNKKNTFLNTNKKEATNSSRASLRERMDKILRVINAFGDYERVSQGVFENYPNMSIKDSSLMSICHSLEWFCFMDVLNKQIYTLQYYGLTSYVPYAFVVWNFAFGSTAWQKITYPNAGYEDVIVHVEDLSSEDLLHQRNHVLSTLNDLAKKSGSEDLLSKVITVGNKYDLCKNANALEESVIVSAMTHFGIDTLCERIEQAVLKATNRRTITIKVPSGSKEMQWLYKNGAVIKVAEDPSNAECQIMKLVISDRKFDQFKHYFIKAA